MRTTCSQITKQLGWISESQKTEPPLRGSLRRNDGSIMKTHLVLCYEMVDRDRRRIRLFLRHQDHQSATSITTHHQCSVDRPTTRVGSISVSACNLPRRMLMDFGGSSPFVSLSRKTPLDTPRPCCVLGPERIRVQKTTEPEKVS